jgi:EPS-associated MarR family transcriptional regulator
LNAPPVLDEETRFRLLRLLQANPELSQRQLAEELGVSVGKINYCLRALLEKGLVKMRNFRDNQNKLAYAYYLTPKGAREKLRATAEFLEIRQREYAQIRQEIEELKREVGADAAGEAKHGVH